MTNAQMERRWCHGREGIGV